MARDIESQPNPEKPKKGKSFEFDLKRIQEDLDKGNIQEKAEQARKKEPQSSEQMSSRIEEMKKGIGEDEKIESSEDLGYLTGKEQFLSIIENKGNLWDSGRAGTIFNNIFHDMEKTMAREGKITEEDIKQFIYKETVVRFFGKKIDERELSKDIEDEFVSLFFRLEQYIIGQIERNIDFEKRNPRKQWYQFWKK